MKHFLFYIFLLIFIIGCAKQNIEQNEIQETEVVEMKLTSSAFTHNGNIPPEYTCDGSDLSPPLSISDVPTNAKSLVLISDDPDAPVGTWDHWIVFNIPPSTKEIAKGKESQGTPGKNSWGRTGYGGPCPPSGTHRYFFKLYALDTQLNLPEGSAKKDLEKEMQRYMIAKAELMGNYKRR